ncbi:MAG TPA: LOG family protein [Opitutaceae bacterium]|nr:LOG family protein [Opitutaceae bacterium]
MIPTEFWHSQDGQILALRKKNETLALTLAFKPRSAGELAFMRENLGSLHFTERSSLARIGIEMNTVTRPVIENNKVLFEAEAFVFDRGFPNATYFQKLLRPGTPVGRLFYAPESAKLSSDEIWRAVKENRIKLPSTVSIDRFGRVFIVPHSVRYTINPAVTRLQFERVVSGEQTRGFLDKVQLREEVAPLVIPPRSGVLTSCSMYLKEHFVVLNRGEDNFGLHCSAVLLDPLKTFGTNIMLEIYNKGDQPVVNPMVSVEVFRAPVPDGAEDQSLLGRRKRMLSFAGRAFRHLDSTKPEELGTPKPRTKITVKGQNALMENRSLFLACGPDFRELAVAASMPAGHRTIIEALDHAPDGADTLVCDIFPNLLEHIELLTRLPQLGLKRIVFRKPSRTHGFFFSTNAHTRIDHYDSIGLGVYFYHEDTKDIYRHVYKKGCGFFVREELTRKFMESTILAFYGSALDLSDETGRSIQDLLTRLTDFFGPTVGVLTGGGGGVMGLATEQARLKNALTGSCFLELEAQPPKLGVDFFNSFQETARHNRQKWFEVADFCIFNVGGVGTLEEVGIEMCNLKLGIRPRVPYVFYATSYWRDLKKQLKMMVAEKRAPRWIDDYVLFSDKPDEVVAFYRKTLQVL